MEHEPSNNGAQDRLFSDFDIDVILFGLGEKLDPEDGHLLQVLLLDDRLFKLRLAFIDTLANSTGGPVLLDDWKEFEHEVQIIEESGVVEGLREGVLDPNRLIMLSFRPAALIEAQRRLLKDIVE